MILDTAIIRALPVGCKVLEVGQHGDTSFAKGLKLLVELKGGEQKRYFVKITEGEHAVGMVAGEFASQQAMHGCIPANTAVPVACGRLDGHNSDELDRGFYMCEFHPFEAAPKPSPAEMAEILARMHSRFSPPSGKFGFPVPTYRGFLPTRNEWCDSWEEWFARQFRADVETYQAMRDTDPELEKLLEPFVAKVIPRLLRPLQTEGRTIRPALVHSDLWFGNIQRDADTGNFMLFDGCNFYGHHEAELSMFLNPRYGWGVEYVEEYKKLMPPSEPAEDFDDRLALYALRAYLVSAALWDGYWADRIQFVKSEMRRLLAHYPMELKGHAKMCPE